MAPVQYRSSSSSQTSAMQQPPSGSSLPGSSQIGGDSFSQTLYKIPGYSYAHTLAFLELFSPSAEKKIIGAFKKVKGRSWHAELPPISDFKNQGTPANGSENQWWAFAQDLREMGLGWAERQFAPLPAVQAPGTGSTEGQAGHLPTPSVADSGSDTEPDAVMEAMAERALRRKAARAKAAAKAAHEPCKTPEAVSDDSPALRKAMTDTDMALDNRETLCGAGQPSAGSGSDTEVDSEAERIAQRYLRRTRPACDWRSSGVKAGRVSKYPVDTKRILHRRPAPPPPKEGWPSFDPEAEVEYPTLPPLPSFPSQNEPVVAPPVPVRPVLNDAPHPNLPPVQAATPGGYLPTYRPRQPNDTVFHRGSAGVNPDGAHARPAFKRPSRPTTGAVGISGVLRHHRIVSGSFGSFETVKPDRFRDRPYRLFKERQQKNDEKKKAGNKHTEE